MTENQAKENPHKKLSKIIRILARKIAEKKLIRNNQAGNIQNKLAQGKKQAKKVGNKI